MKAFPIILILGAAALALSGQPAPEPASAAPLVVVDHALVAERDALKAEVESLRAEIASLKSALSQRQVVPSRPDPVAVKPPAAAAGPVAYYQRRAVYGGFRGNRIVGYQTVLVTSQQQTYAAGDCPRGNCSTLGRGIIFGRRR